MSKKIRMGIVGYGNLGRGAERAVANNPDMELVGIFSRRNLSGTDSGVPMISIADAKAYQEKIDVMLLCGGSAVDLLEQGPQFAQLFNTVDSFDTHARIPDYHAEMDRVAKQSGKIAAISVGWDPGLFSLVRLLFASVLPKGVDHTFWGKGVSQGHSDAIRQIPGVKNAKQYTIPKEEIVSAVRTGKSVSANAYSSHIRDCYVVADPSADLPAIEYAIKTMPYYFRDYETHVTFLTEEEFDAKHAGLAHGGFVFRSGETSPATKHVLEFALTLDSNAEFTSSVLTAYARGVYRMAQTGFRGACTVFDIPPAYLFPESPDEQRKKLL